MSTGQTTPSCNGKSFDRATLTLIQSTRLKAVSCREGTASLVVTQSFQVLPGPVILLSFKISGSVSAAGLSDDMKVAFVDALVEMLGLPSKDLVQDIAVKEMLDEDCSRLIFQWVF
jgi:hypothetical protein